jgi:hypothetical protein
MSRQIKKMNIRLEDGKPAVLSAAEIAPGVFEVMLASPDFGTEYATRRSESEKTALDDFKSLRKKYHVPELSGKYAKLRDDLKAAAEQAREVAKNTDDGGTCNFDAATIRLPGWNSKKVEQAARAAGVGFFVWNLWGSKSFVFPLPGTGQGNARTEAAEAMREALTGMGYDAGMYCQID